MQTIHILSDRTIDQIAAGEVIENPASVVKELVENSIDAGSSHIVVSIRGGGLQQITVSDDGKGMSSDDAILCFERHATSKITSGEDLFAICSMGFRGEALASIGAISKVTITTAREGKTGTQVVMEGGKLICSSPVAREKGTTVEVRSLFYNVPARRKFQRSTAQCSAEITRTVASLALAHPEVGITLRNGDAEVFSLKREEGNLGELIQKRAGVVLGSVFSEEGALLDEREGGMELTGWIGKPTSTKPNRTGQHFFTNRRAIQSPLLSKALKEGYGTRIETLRFPLCVLHLTIPSQEIDVNVHPQKREVRFQEEEKVKRLVERGVEAAFVPQLTTVTLPSHFYEREETFNEEPLCFEEEIPENVQTIPQLDFIPSAIGMFEKYLIVLGSSLEEFWREISDEEEGIVLFNLEEVYSRILYERLMKNRAVEMSQGILVPVIVEFSFEESQRLENQLDQLMQLGFDVRSFGKNAFAVESVPSFLGMGEVEPLLRDLVAELERVSAEDLVQKKWAETIARRAKGQKKSFVVQEGIELLKEVFREKYPLDSIEGKPLHKALGRGALDRLFERS